MVIAQQILAYRADLPFLAQVPGQLQIHPCVRRNLQRRQPIHKISVPVEFETVRKREVGTKLRLMLRAGTVSLRGGCCVGAPRSGLKVNLHQAVSGTDRAPRQRLPTRTDLQSVTVSVNVVPGVFGINNVNGRGIGLQKWSAWLVSPLMVVGIKER